MVTIEREISDVAIAITVIPLLDLCTEMIRVHREFSSAANSSAA
jgi:hypothetical protein